MAYNLTKEEDDDIYALMKKIEKRLLINTKELDYEIVSKRILRDFRQGKFGKFFLELPERK